MSERGDGGDCGPGVRTSAGQPAALLHLAVDDMSSVKIRLVVKNILCPRRPGPRCSPPAEDVEARAAGRQKTCPIHPNIV